MALALQTALELCVDRIANSTTHKHYDRTVKMAKLYKQLITGEDQDELLKKYFSKASKDELEKIEHITVPITGTVMNSLNKAFRKVVRTRPILRQIDFAGEGVDDKVKTVEEKLAKYHGNSSFENWMADVLHDLSFSDPNAFVVTEFKLEADKTRKIYPFVVPSCEAVNFSYDNGVLQWLLVEQQITYMNKEGKPEAGVKLFLYFEQYAVTFTQVEKAGALTTGPIQIDQNKGRYNNDKGSFEVEVFEHAAMQVPAYRVGYVPDLKTDGETYVSPVHYGAVPYLLKTITSVTEFDLSMWAHAFPQKIAYVEKCKTDMNGVCGLSGESIANCKKCGGTGRPLHRKATDTIEVDMPKDTTEFFDLEKFIAYKFPPVEGITLMKEYITDLKMDCYKAVFNAETFSKDQIAQTATGVNLNLQNVYDTLSQYANMLSKAWVYTVQIVSQYEGITQDSNHRLIYPTDFKLKSLTDLLADLKTANDSGAPSFVKTALSRDQAQIIYADMPNELLKFDVKQRLYPFAGKSPNETLAIINGNMCRKVDAITYAYFDQICDELDQESLLDNTQLENLLEGAVLEQYKKARQANLIWFYDLPFSVQRALMEAKANELLAAIEAEKTTVPDFGGADGANPNNP